VWRRACFELGRTVAGDDLFLLALTELDDDQPARLALAHESVDHDRLLSVIRTSGDHPPDSAQILTFSPAYYTVHGRAQGFAAVLGDGRITPEHLLLALIWDPASHSSYLLWRLGAGRERVVEHLGELGVPVPSAPLPPQREIEWGERVWFDRADTTPVLDQIRLHVAPDIRWGFNYEDDRAWAVAEASVDLDALVSAGCAARQSPRTNASE
jgi:hypothetical protein